jgi:alpha-N-arabinofuranosidase
MKYKTPDAFVNSFHTFDSQSTSHQLLVGEYAAVQPNLVTNQDTNWGAPSSPYPFWLGAVAEAIFEIGCERNANKIIGMSYAPLLENRNSIQWKPDLISFTADTSQTLTSTSWEQIKVRFPPDPLHW